MDQGMRRERVLHPYFFALFPVISFYTHNFELMTNAEFSTIVLAPAMAVLTAGLILILKRPLADRHKRGLVVTLFWLFMFSIPHAASLAERFTDAGHLEIVLSALLLLVALPLLSFAVARSRRSFAAVTSYLNWAGFFALLLPLLVLGYKLFFRGLLAAAPAEAAVAAPAGKRPDIYYIIMDGYGRADVLKDIYGYDNSPFLDYLRNKGFYVAGKSAANYNQSLFSLTSSLNMVYLQRVSNPSLCRKEMSTMLNKTTALETLSRNGYKTVSFSTGDRLAEVRKVDVFLEPGGVRSEFQDVLLELTPLGKLGGLLTGKSQRENHLARVLYTFANVPRVRRIVPGKQPIFVIAHIVSPHPPFVFSSPTDKNAADGSHWHRQGTEAIAEYIRLYRAQLEVVNLKLMEMLDGLMANEPDAVIVLQADHGPGSGLDWNSLENSNVRERMGILNAYYFPDRGYESLRADITPVNSFRVIFTKYFAAGLDPVPDRSFFALWNTPCDFREVTGKLDEVVLK